MPAAVQSAARRRRRSQSVINVGLLRPRYSERASTASVSAKTAQSGHWRALGKLGSFNHLRIARTEQGRWVTALINLAPLPCVWLRDLSDAIRPDGRHVNVARNPHGLRGADCGRGAARIGQQHDLTGLHGYCK